MEVIDIRWSLKHIYTRYAATSPKEVKEVKCRSRFWVARERVRRGVAR